MNLSEIKRFAYAAYRAASNSRADAITALDAVITGNYTSITSGGGRVMTAATATNKSFSYTLPAGYGPKEIGEMAYGAVRFLAGCTDDNVETRLTSFPKTSALARFA